jgi:hypothetical protein
MKHFTLIALLIAAAAPAHASTNRQVEVGELVLKNLGSDPSSPASGKVTIFSRSSTGKQYKKDSSGNVSQIGGAGGGGVNFIGQTTTWSPDNTDDRDLETSVGNWLAFKDAAASIPVDLTGGSPSVTCTRSTSDPFDGTASLLMAFPASNTQGEGCSVVFNVQPAYQGRNVTISSSLGVVSGSIVSGDVGVWVYNVTKTSLIQAQSGASACSIMGQDLTCTFPTTGRDATPVNHQYRLGFYRASTSTTAVTVKGDNFKISPETTPQGMAGSDCQAYTMTVTGSTSNPTKSSSPVTDAAYGCRVGDSLEIQYDFIASGTTGAAAGSGTYIFGLPSGLTIDTAKVTASTAQGKGTVGSAMVGTATANFWGSAKVYNSTGIALEVGNETTGKSQIGSAFQPFTTSSLNYSFRARVPIVGWASNVQIGESSTFRISTYLANGTRVTGSAPTALGQYRSYLRNASANTYTETNGNPTTTPTIADGIALYRPTAWGTASTNNSPVKYEIFVGKNKPAVRFDFYGSSGRTGAIDAKPGEYATSRAIGLSTSYDPTTGIATVVSPADANYTNAGFLGWDGTGAVQATGAFFDISVSENPQFVGSQSPRSVVRLTTGNGHGSVNTKIRRFTTIVENKGTAITYADSATAGASFTINEDGVYSMTYVDAKSSGGWNVGISKNSTQLTTSIASVTDADVLMMNEGGTNQKNIVSATVPLVAGDVIRPHTDGGVDQTTYTRFVITKVSN